MGREGKLADRESYKDKALKTAAKGSVIVFFGMLFDRGFGYLTRLVLARGLTLPEYGLFFLATSILTIGITLAVNGFHGAVIRYVAYYLGKNDKKRLLGTIRSAFELGICLSIIVFLVMFFFAEAIASFFSGPELVPLIRMFSFVILSIAFLRIPIAVTMGLKTMKYDVFIKRVFKAVSTLIILLVLFFTGFGLMGAVYAYIIGYFSTAVLAYYFMRKKLKSVIGDYSAREPMARKLLTFSLPLVFSGIIWSILGHLDIIMLGMFKTLSDVGLYNIALPHAQLLLVIPPVLFALNFPIASYLYSKNKMNEMAGIYRTMTRWNLYLNFPVFLVIFSFPNEMIGFFFGQEFTINGIAAGVQMILAIGYFVYSFVALPRYIIIVLERTQLVFVNSIAVLVMNILLNLLLIPPYGLNGAAAATTLSFIFFYALNYVESYKISRSYLSGAHLFEWNMLKSLVVGVCAIAMARFIHSVFFVTNNMGFLFSATIFLVIYAALLFFMKGLQKDDVFLLEVLENRLGIRNKRLSKIINRFSH